jgi:hypothetical protein
MRKTAWSVAAVLVVIIAFTGGLDQLSEQTAADGLK